VSKELTKMRKSENFMLRLFADRVFDWCIIPQVLASLRRFTSNMAAVTTAQILSPRVFVFNTWTYYISLLRVTSVYNFRMFT